MLPTEPAHNMDRIIRTEDDHLIDGQINFPTEAIEIDRILDTTVTKMKLGEKKEVFRVPHQDKKETFQKEIHFANLRTHHLEDQTVIQPVIPLLIKKKIRKATTNHQQLWFSSPTLMIASTNYQNFVR